MASKSSRGVQRPRVLVVDDEPLICDVLRMMLEDDHDVVTATSGAQAQHVVDTEPPFDAILCDLMMSGVSGIDLHAWLKSTHPELVERVVYMTGGVYTALAQQFVDAIPNRFISKPLLWATVQEAVRAVVNRSQGFESPAAQAEL